MKDALWFALALLGVLAAMAIAVPITVLTWWAGWTQRTNPTPPIGSSPGDSPGKVAPSDQANSTTLTPSSFLVYFSGVGDISDVYQSRYEDELLDAVRARVPDLVVITDVFGFSVDNLSMTSQRRLGWFWSWVNDVRLRKDSPFKRAGLLINLRNILHVSVSADSRYGPVYNYSVAEMVLQSLVRHGYVLGSGAPIAHMGFSGGGQMALATAGTVAATLAAPVQVISMGGIMNANPSLGAITRLTLLYGTHDHVQSLSDWIFPARWPLLKNSTWNRALREGKIQPLCLGPMGHTKRNSYLDGTVYLPDGRSYRDVTADTIAALVAPAVTPAAS
jgi:hypothetical protein